ncbi:hypothetical protein SDC9_95435 [bioreactor metagenome]|uniref:Uncharacterized protein n=1 Tax=bioreactor metagenome TaxID=1076179 RepID=A0A645A6C3_9ZZZZ
MCLQITLYQYPKKPRCHSKKQNRFTSHLWLLLWGLLYSFACQHPGEQKITDPSFKMSLCRIRCFFLRHLTWRCRSAAFTPILKILFKVELRPDCMVPTPAVKFVCTFSCLTRSEANPRSTGFLGPLFNFCQQGFADTLLFVFA